MEGRAVTITGAGSGIGRATALLLGAEGAQVVAGDIDPDTATETARLVCAAGGVAIAREVDVTDEISVQAFVESATTEFGRLDGAFNNAGVLGPVGDLTDLPPAELDRVFAVNVRGVVLCMQAQVRVMLLQTPPAGAHSIVNTASVAGLIGSPQLAVYSASKHAVVGLTRSVARSYGRRGVRVNCVCPGPIETPLASPWFDQGDTRAMLLARQALDRFGTAGEVASLVLWLLSAEASLVTGTPVRVDAGSLS